MSTEEEDTYSTKEILEQVKEHMDIQFALMGARVSTLEKFIWTCMGAIAILGIIVTPLLKNISFGVSNQASAASSVTEQK